MIPYKSHITHLTSVHPRFDTRIFHKMCSSLVEHGSIVNLIVADGKGDEVNNGIRITDVGTFKNRLIRINLAPKQIFDKAVTLNSDIYHLHDPELIPIGLKLKKLGKKVIFDSHEDIPQQIISKSYMNPSVRWFTSKAFDFYQTWSCKQFDGIIAATPLIKDKFLAINSNTENINNFPILDELRNNIKWEHKQPFVSYVGSMTNYRGIKEIIKAMELVQSPVRLNLAGKFVEKKLYEDVVKLSGWKRTNNIGFISREGVHDLLMQSIAGLVTLHPVVNHIDALPVKLFEYMSSKIPVIASDFPLWRKIITKNDCGILVDPLNPVQIAETIDYLVTHPKEAERMGHNGRRAVIEHYNWRNEEKKLLQFYKKIIH